MATVSRYALGKVCDGPHRPHGFDWCGRIHSVRHVQRNGGFDNPIGVVCGGTISWVAADMSQGELPTLGCPVQIAR